MMLEVRTIDEEENFSGLELKMISTFGCLYGLPFVFPFRYIAELSTSDM